jgi:hypothetical protein
MKRTLLLLAAILLTLAEWALGDSELTVNEAYLKKQIGSQGAVPVAKELFRCAGEHLAAQNMFDSVAESRGVDAGTSTGENGRFFAGQGILILRDYTDLEREDAEEIMTSSWEPAYMDWATNFMVGGAQWLGEWRNNESTLRCWFFMFPESEVRQKVGTKKHSGSKNISLEDSDLLVKRASKPLSNPLRLPFVISDLRRGEAINNETEEPGFGLTIPYSNANAKATIYLYDAGLDEIPSNPESKAVHGEFRNAMSNLKILEGMGAYDNLQQRDGAYYSGSPERGFEFICGDLEYENRGTNIYSMMCVTGHEDHFVKVRISSSKRNYPLREFVDSAAALLALDR